MPSLRVVLRFEIGLRSHPSTPTYFPPLFSFVVDSGL